MNLIKLFLLIILLVPAFVIAQEFIGANEGGSTVVTTPEEKSCIAINKCEAAIAQKTAEVRAEERGIRNRGLMLIILLMLLTWFFKNISKIKPDKKRPITHHSGLN